MGVEPYLVASAVEAVMAQRLVRTVCENCREPYRPSRDDLPSDLILDDDATLYHGAGCRQCRHTGLRGRVGVFELVRFDGEFRDAVMERAPSGKLMEIAGRSGMKTLREDGWDKVRAGLTVPQEVLRVTVAGVSKNGNV